MSSSKTGRKIRALRRKLRLSAGEVAFRAGLTPNHIYVLERGEKIARQDTMQRIAHVLNSTVEQLTG